nr:hypothetical protein [Tanacetum cinerariifolium]
MLDEKLVLVDEHRKQLEMKVTNKASASKPNTFMGDQLVESDEDEAELLDDETSRYMSSTGGGRYREDDLNFYDEYEAQVYDLPKQMHTFPSTPPSYSSGPSTPPNYSSGSSRNAECSNCKHLRGKISVLKATMNMHMHPEQHTVNSAALLHEVLN